MLQSSRCSVCGQEDTDHVESQFAVRQSGLGQETDGQASQSQLLVVTDGCQWAAVVRRPTGLDLRDDDVATPVVQRDEVEFAPDFAAHQTPVAGHNLVTKTLEMCRGHGFTDGASGNVVG